MKEEVCFPGNVFFRRESKLQTERRTRKKISGIGGAKGTCLISEKEKKKRHHKDGKEGGNCPAKVRLKGKKVCGGRSGAGAGKGGLVVRDKKVVFRRRKTEVCRRVIEKGATGIIRKDAHRRGKKTRAPGTRRPLQVLKKREKHAGPQGSEEKR